MTKVVQSVVSSDMSGAKTSAASSAGLELLSFFLEDEEYGIDIRKAQEIRGYENVTRIANAPLGQILPAPEMNATLDTAYMRGLGAPDERVMVLVDIDKLLSGPDIG